MPLLGTAEYRDELMRVISATETDLDIVSAFITHEGIAAILRVMPPTIAVRVLTRWRLADLVSGASSLEVFPLLQERRIRLFVNQSLHAKLVMSDKKMVLVGSANITGRGLSLEFARMNFEIGIVVNADRNDLKVIDQIFADSVEITDSLFREISACVETSQLSSTPNESEYPANVLASLSPPVSGLWVRDLLWSANPGEVWLDNPDSIHDRALLGLDSNPVPLSGEAFRKLKCVIWLSQTLLDYGGELYFGGVSSHLHDALLEDPKPYRKEVKNLAANLFEWCAGTLPDTFVADSPGFSQRIRFTNTPAASVSEEAWLTTILNLRQDHDTRTWNRKTLFASPHKPIFILTTLKVLFATEPPPNSFSLSLEVTAEFFSLWSKIFSDDRHGDPFLPFVHLSTDGLWTLRSGSTLLTAMQARSLRQVDRESIRAEFSPGLYQALRSSGFRDRTTTAILGRYFDQGTAADLGLGLPH